MRVVLDTNILVSALLIQAGFPDAIYRGWNAGEFILITSELQLDELRATLRKPAIARRIKPPASEIASRKSSPESDDRVTRGNLPMISANAPISLIKRPALCGLLCCSRKIKQVIAGLSNSGIGRTDQSHWLFSPAAPILHPSGLTPEAGTLPRTKGRRPVRRSMSAF